jgi:predicted secreted acid phosphatase
MNESVQNTVSITEQQFINNKYYYSSRWHSWEQLDAVAKVLRRMT